MSLTVLMNAGPWLAVPPRHYGGIENVIASLVPELRRRGVRVVLCTVGESTIEVDGRRVSFAEGQFGQLGGAYGQVVGITHAHMLHVLDELGRRPEVDLVHDHLEVVGPSLLAALGPDAPPVLETLHWDLGKHPEFYSRFDGRGRVFFNFVSASQCRNAPTALREQSAGVVPLAVPLDAHTFQPVKGDRFLTLGRFTPAKGVDTAARICRELGLPLDMAGPVGGVPDPERLRRALDDPDSPQHAYADVRYYLDAVRPHEDGARVSWVGTVGGAAKQALVGAAKAVLMPIRWDEPGGTAAIEALACGTPVIAMRRGALDEIVEHGVNGFLADDEDEFARWLPLAGELDPLACRRSVEERFSAPAMADAYLRLYHEVLARSRSPVRPRGYRSAS
jgi:glycosyltransferase involved in cell wall biosynthesis